MRGKRDDSFHCFFVFCCILTSLFAGGPGWLTLLLRMSAILICFQQKSEVRLLALARGDLGAESDEERTTEGMG